MSDRTTPPTPTTTPRTAAEATLLETAARRLPGGVLGAARFADDLAFVVKRAQGSHLWDVSGREYIDYLLGSGPMFLGHSHPAVVRAVTEQLASGSTYFLVNEPAITLADEVCRAVPCGEQIRFTSTGAEATFFALRAARAFRKRDKILKFEGGYHGSHDYALMSQTPKSPKAFPAPMPDSGGIPHAIQDQVLIAPYNDLATVEALIAEHGHELAAVIVEPFQRLIPPHARVPGRAARDHAAPRRSRSSSTRWSPASGSPTAAPRSTTASRRTWPPYGKIIGGGFPLAAVVGRDGDHAGLRSRAWTARPTTSRRSGTLNGNPIAAVAGLAALAELRKPGVYERVRTIGGSLMAGLTDLVKKTGVVAQVVGEPTVFDIVFTDQPVIDYRAVITADSAKLRRFNEVCLRNGVLKGGSKIYVSIAHDEADVERTLAVFKQALEAAARL